jgi:hypothetical protein
MIKSWKNLESDILSHCKKRMAHHAVFIHRLSDTRAAGAYIAAQPSDFLVLPQVGRTTFLEAKFSEAHESLRSCFASAVDGQQLASARLVERANRTYNILFYSGVSGVAELWSGLYCAECRAQGKRLDLSRRLAVCSSLTEMLDLHVLRLRKFL